MAYSVIDKVYTIFIDVMTGSSNGYGKPTFYNTDSHTSFIELTVTNGSKEFNMTEFSYMFTVEKPDGTKYTNEYTTQDKSKLVIPVDAQMISCTGNCNAQLYVNKEVDGVNKTLTMVEFNYTVYKGLHEGLISESIDFDNVYVKILNKLDYIISNGADLTGDQAAQLSYAYQHSKSPHAPANIVETMHTEIGEAIDAHHKKVALSASQANNYTGTSPISVDQTKEGVTRLLNVKGRTLQNVCVKPIFNTSGSHTKEDMAEYIKATSIDAPYCYAIVEMKGTLFVENNPYTLVYDREDSSDSVKVTLIRCIYTDNTTLDTVVTQTGKVVASFTPKKPISRIEMYCYATRDTVKVGAWVKVYKKVMIIKGDYTQPNSYSLPPYFEGIKNVGEYGDGETTRLVYGSCGKNLMKTSTLEIQATEGGSTYIVLDKIIEKNIEVDPRKSYRLSGISNKEGVQVIALGCNTPIPSTIINHNGAYSFCISNGGTQAEQNTVISGYKYITITTGGSAHIGLVQVGETVAFSELQLEEGTIATAYEPYQEDLKDVTAPIKGGLKALPNGIHDRAFSDSNTRYKVGVNQCVGEYTFTGDEVWSDNGDVSNEKTLYFYTDVLDSKMKENSIGALICNTLPVIQNFSETVTVDSIMNAYPNSIRIRISRDKLATPDVEGLKKWLKANPTTVWYALKSPLWHTLDTPLVGNVKTYEGITHVFSNSELSPEFAFSLGYVILNTDAKQYCTVDKDMNFVLPKVTDYSENNSLEIHLFVKMNDRASLTFPSNILWNDLTKMSEITIGSIAEFIFTYIKTAEGGSWLGTVVPHK